MVNNEKLTVAGAGIMGHSIALTAAWAGIEVVLWGTNEEDIAIAKEGIKNKVDSLISYEVIEENERENILTRVSYTQSLEESMSQATFVIEAIPENLELKQKFFKQIEGLCSNDTILSSNTSGLSATEISKLTKLPGRTTVTHFWMPAHLMPLVEVIRGNKTSDETIERAMNLIEKMNKKPVLVKKDVLGQVGNRLQYAVFREAQFIYENEIASIEDIDAAIKYSLGRRFGVTGPFMTMDMGGLNTNSSITSYLFEDLSDRKNIFPTMEKLVKNNRIGPKTGEGFYDWTPEFIEKMEKEREKELISWIKKDLDKN